MKEILRGLLLYEFFEFKDVWLPTSPVAHWAGDSTSGGIAWRSMLMISSWYTDDEMDSMVWADNLNFALKMTVDGISLWNFVLVSLLKQSGIFA